MAMLSIGDAVRLTGIKAHVLRYREQLIPLIMPRKDKSGRRVYTIRDIQLLMRFEYLVKKHQLSIDQARDRLLQELELNNSDLMSSILQVKADLINLYVAAKKCPLHPYRISNEKKL